MKVKSTWVFSKENPNIGGYVPNVVWEHWQTFQNINKDNIGEELEILDIQSKGVFAYMNMEMILVQSITDEENIYCRVVTTVGEALYDATSDNDTEIDLYVYQGLCKAEYERAMAIRDYLIQQLQKTDKELATGQTHWGKFEINYSKLLNKESGAPVAKSRLMTENGYIEIDEEVAKYVFGLQKQIKSLMEKVGDLTIESLGK